jgi:HEAT repeat protein
MALDDSNLVVLLSLGLLALLGMLVLAKRMHRDGAERRSRRRRLRWVTALGSGPVEDIRFGALRALAQHAAHTAAGQEDLLAVLAAGDLPPRDGRREPFERTLRVSGLRRAFRKAFARGGAAARGRAALLWAQLGLPDAEQAIAPLMSDPDPDVRAAATQALATCGSEEAAWTLLYALRDGLVEPQRVVERLTGHWAAGPLLAALRDDGFEHVSSWLAEALGITGDARAEGPLANLVTGGDEEQRIRACRALGRLGRRSSASVLIGALADPSPAVRAQAARGLAEMREVRSVDALTVLMSDSAWWVRARAADALRALGDPGLAALRACVHAHPDPFARERAAEALAMEDVASVEVAA